MKGTINEYVETIFKEGRFKNLCKKIAKDPDKAEELHSEFILKLLNEGDEILKTAQNIDNYCVAIIYNIWKDKDKIKITTGKTSPLFLYSSTLDVDVSYNLDSENDFEYFEPYDENIDYKVELVSKIIEKEKQSPNIKRMYQATIYYEAHKEHRGIKKFAQDIKIPYFSVRKTIKEFKEILKTELEKYD